MSAPNQTMHLALYEERICRTLNALDRQNFVDRLWQRDTSLWRQGPNADEEIKNRLGWLGIVQAMQDKIDDLTKFVEEIKNEGYQCAVLMGMGGSSLSPEVSKLTFGTSPSFLDLIVLDSTVPSAVRYVEKEISGKKTLFIVSSKSGDTIETMSAYLYFSQAKHLTPTPNPQDFIAITDQGTSLHKLGESKDFRKVFLNPPDIGGRYSALSLFGLVPAALLGVDINELLNRASQMASLCRNSQTSENPGVMLGAIMAELALMGRDKMTLVTSPEIQSFGSWIEQLVAESTGKNGRGILPVDLEPLATPNCYSDDRWFVYIRLASSANSDLDAKVKNLINAGFPVVQIELGDKYDLGAEYFRWEIATATSSALLGVNAFDQPNVKESKDITQELLAAFTQKGSLPSETSILSEDDIELYCDQRIKNELDAVRKNMGIVEDNICANLNAFLNLLQPSNYVAIMAFLLKTPNVDQLLERIRQCIRNAHGTAVTVGYGPRFLHSTGQMHKGGPNSGLFIQITSEDPEGIDIPGKNYNFSTLKQAQAIGDAEALRQKGRPLIRIHLGLDVETNLEKVATWVEKAVSK